MPGLIDFAGAVAQGFQSFNKSARESQMRRRKQASDDENRAIRRKQLDLQEKIYEKRYGSSPDKDEDKWLGSATKALTAYGEDGPIMKETQEIRGGINDLLKKRYQKLLKSSEGPQQPVDRPAREYQPLMENAEKLPLDFGVRADDNLLDDGSENDGALPMDLGDDEADREPQGLLDKPQGLLNQPKGFINRGPAGTSDAFKGVQYDYDPSRYLPGTKPRKAREFESSRRMKEAEKRSEDMKYQDEARIPNLELQQGYRPDSTSIRDVRGAQTASQNLRSIINQLDSLVAEHGTEVMPTSAKKQMQLLQNELVTQMKEIDKLGALAGPDMQLELGKLGDPTELSFTNVANPGGADLYRQGYKRLKSLAALKASRGASNSGYKSGPIEMSNGQETRAVPPEHIEEAMKEGYWAK